MVNVGDFLKESEKYEKEVEDLSLFYQLQNQRAVEVYEEFKGKKNYSGSFYNYIAMKNVEELFEHDKKPWKVLMQAIFLTDNVGTKIDMERIIYLDNETKKEFLEIIYNGLIAKKKIFEWLKPIYEKKIIKDSIYSATKVGINGKYSQFKILDLGNIESECNAEIKIYENFVEVKDVDTFISYIKNTKNRSNKLIVGFTRDNDVDYKNNFLIFLIYGKKLYSINNISRRLNINNSAGSRNPGRFLDREYENVNLPIDILFDDGEIGDLFDEGIIKYGEEKIRSVPISKIREKYPGSMEWLEMFTYRCISIIGKEKLQLAYTPKKSLALLEDMNKKDKRDFDYSESHNHINDYLEDKYGKNVSALVTKSKNLTKNMIGTLDHMRGIFQYERRKNYAELIEKELIKNYKKRRKEVYYWVRNVVFETYTMKDHLIKAFKDEEYEREYDKTFASDKKLKHKELYKEKVFCKIGRTPYFFYGERKEKYPLYFVLTNNNQFYAERKAGTRTFDNVNKNKCVYCEKSRYTRIVSLEFKDFRQFLKFYNLEEKDAPEELILHFNQRNDAYYGNNILDDVDPVDLIVDPWFRSGESNNPDCVMFSPSNSGSKKEIRVYFPICKRCEKKILKEVNEK
ncbi:MAG: hypothetical protein ACE5RP_00260 [Nitrosopumilus sp.]